jgi:molybdenum cofactor cytidylyltransferase/nicotine blue oxidoreductase
MVLAAGEGRRMGGPKALLRDDTGEPWVSRAVRGLLQAGCDEVSVVLGASSDEAVRLVPEDERVTVVVADDWQQGMGESLRAGLRHLTGSQARAAVVTLVDLPDVGAPVVARVLEAWAGTPAPSAAVARAVYGGRPGHPVVIGRDHWLPLLETLHGDVGAQHYLTRQAVRRSVEDVECADLATGRDVDRPDGAGP